MRNAETRYKRTEDREYNRRGAYNYQCGFA